MKKSYNVRMTADDAPSFMRGGQATEMPKRHSGKKGKGRKKGKKC